MTGGPAAAARFAAIENWMDAHREEIISDLIRLVRIPSVSAAGVSESAPFGQACRDALDAFLSLAEGYRFSVRNYGNRCCAVWYGTEALQTRTGLWGHLDVVPAGSGWLHPPFGGTREGDFLFGRGVQDNKGPLIGMLHLLRCLHELGCDSGSFALFAGCDEEAGMRDVTWLARQKDVCPRLSIVTDCGFPVCYGEKGILEVSLVSDFPVSSGILECRGGEVSNQVPSLAYVLMKQDAVLFPEAPEIRIDSEPAGVKITACGISAHAAFPQTGRNAVSLLSRYLAGTNLLSEEETLFFRLVARADEHSDGSGLGIACRDEESGPLTCVASLLSTDGGHWNLTLNIRYPVTADSSRIQQQIEKTCRAFHCRSVVRKDSRPNYFPKDDPAVTILTDTYRELSGSSAEAYVMSGGTYARRLPNAFACGIGMPFEPPLPVLPPGHGGCHAPDEMQQISVLLKGVSYMGECLMRLKENQNAR